MAEEKSNALIGAMQSQKEQILNEIEEIKAENKTMQEELKQSKEREKQLQSKVEFTSTDKLKYEKEMLLALSDPQKFVEAAKSLDMRQLQWVNYQLGLMMNGSYAMPQQPQMTYQMPAPQMYPYYQYPPMMPPPMYKNPYMPYNDRSED